MFSDFVVHLFLYSFAFYSVLVYEGLFPPVDVRLTSCNAWFVVGIHFHSLSWYDTFYTDIDVGCCYLPRFLDVALLPEHAPVSEGLGGLGYRANL